MPEKIKDEITSSALELIGNTPLLALDRLHPGPGRILVKCEFMNPGASVKDRSSLSMIRRALEKGEIKPGDPVFETSSGNQGCGLAVVCAVLGHPLTVAMPSGNSVSRAIHMEALGARVIKVPQVEGTYGHVTNADVLAVKDFGEKHVEKTGSYYVHQFSNKGNSQAHYETTGPEIWRQSGHHVDAFLACVGTAGCFAGTSRYLKEQNPNVKTYVVEAAGSEPIKGDPVIKPQHLLQGSGYGWIPELFVRDHMDGTFAVTDEEAVDYMKLIGEKEGLYVGYTSGANVCAAVKLLKSGLIPEDSWVVTLLCDTGLKYTDTPIH